jgi:hypothetical protein
VNSSEEGLAGQTELDRKLESPFDQAQLLASALGLTQEMLLKAEQEDWQQVADLEIARRRDLELCFSVAITEAKGELIAEALAVLLHLNEELLSALTVARHHAKQARELQLVGQAAASTYHSTRDLA